jgi:hypothetical protein
VLVSVNGNPPAPALVGVGNPPASWSLAGVPLIAGANSISAQCFSIDTNNVQNVSPPAVTTIFYSAAMPVVDATAPLTVLTNGSGSVTGPASLSALELNQVYSVQAVPSGTWAFSNWSMGPDANDLSPVSDSATFSFLMTSNLVIQANFVTNPFRRRRAFIMGCFSRAMASRKPVPVFSPRRSLGEIAALTARKFSLTAGPMGLAAFSITSVMRAQRFAAREKLPSMFRCTSTLARGTIN